jgi:glyoxylase-like metal-dependent hydrolase (beta-lactamase superfamily II)
MSHTKRFKVGKTECVAVNDGTFSYPLGWLFSNVKAEEVEGKLQERGLPTTHVESPYTCIFVNMGKRKILIDTGAANLAPTTGDLFNNLQAEGILPDAITDVILTHAHPDHIGGVLNASGQPAFPNARYVMSKTEWDFWTDPTALHDSAMDDHMKQILLGTAQRNLPALKEHIDLVEGEKEIAPGVQVIPARGHTPGHVAVLISSEGEQLLHMSDAVLHPLHMENPGWRNVFDLEPETAVDTRRALLDRAAADKINVLAYHFPFPGMGRVESKGHAWKWQAA